VEVNARDVLVGFACAALQRYASDKSRLQQIDSHFVRPSFPRTPALLVTKRQIRHLVMVGAMMV
jgi:hypothetical protein